MKRFTFVLTAAVAVSLLSSCATRSNSMAGAQVVTNPVLDANFPDPAVIKAPDGYYYAYATQSEVDSKMQNIQIARSRDMQQW